MTLVVDLSVILAWLFEEVQTPAALKLMPLIREHGLLVPPLWWIELENGLLMAERRSRKTPAELSDFLKLIRDLSIRTDDTPPPRTVDSVLSLARQHQLTAYDATYVELALRESATLATFDAAIRKSADALNIKLLPRETA